MVLIFFEAITDLKVNVGKSEIVLVGEVGNLDALARILCYGEDWFWGEVGEMDEGVYFYNSLFSAYQWVSNWCL